MEKVYLNPKEVSEMLGVSVSTAYKIMRKLNKELEAMSFMTVSGRVNKRYFIEKACYGGLSSTERKES